MTNIETSINEIGDKLINEWIPAAQKDVDARMMKLQTDAKLVYLEAMAQAKFKPRDEALTPEESSNLAFQVASSAKIKSIGGLVEKAKLDLQSIFETHGEIVYRGVADDFAAAFNENTEDGIEFIPEVGQEMIDQIPLMRADGFTWAESVAGILDSGFRRINAQLVQNISEFGNKTTAQDGFLIQYRGIFGTMKKQMGDAMRNLLTQVDKTAETELSELKLEE